MANIADTQIQARALSPVAYPLALIERAWPVAAVGLGGVLTIGWITFLGYNAFTLILSAF